MTLKQKMKTYSFWISLVSALLLVVRLVAEQFGWIINGNVIMDIATGICGVLVLLGILSAPAQQDSEEDSTLEAEESATNSTKESESMEQTENVTAAEAQIVPAENEETSQIANAVNEEKIVAEQNAPIIIINRDENQTNNAKTASISAIIANASINAETTDDTASVAEVDSNQKVDAEDVGEVSVIGVFQDIDNTCASEAAAKADDVVENSEIRVDSASAEAEVDANCRAIEVEAKAESALAEETEAGCVAAAETQNSCVAIENTSISAATDVAETYTENNSSAQSNLSYTENISAQSSQEGEETIENYLNTMTTQELKNLVVTILERLK